MRRAAAALAAAGTLVIGAAGCETTQELSAKIGRRLGHQSAIATTTKLGAVNRDVRVIQTALVAGGGETAVAVELTLAEGAGLVPDLVLECQCHGSPLRRLLRA